MKLRPYAWRVSNSSRVPPGTGLTRTPSSDPTMDRDTVTVLLRGRSLREVASDDGVRVSPVPGGTRLEFDTRHAYGRSFMVTLRG
jgi:hyaluronate lyase